MSYFLADSTGPLVDFASIGGWADFRQWAERHPGPAQKFARHGFTEDLEELVYELEHTTPSPKVAEQHNVLREWARKAKDILILSDGMSDEEPRTAATQTPLHRAADAHVPKFEVLFRYAFAVAKKALGKNKNVDKAIRALEGVLEETLPKHLLGVVESGGQVGMHLVRKKLRVQELRTALDVKYKFNVQDDHAVDWADRHAAELISQISESTREAINNAIAESLEEGGPDAAYDEILAAVGDTERARLIAHHETMMAASFGQRESWRQATEDGLLTGDEKRTWIITPIDVCPICEALDGETAKLDGEYPGEGGEGPPAHVGCRCTEGLV